MDIQDGREWFSVNSYEISVRGRRGEEDRESPIDCDDSGRLFSEILIVENGGMNVWWIGLG